MVLGEKSRAILEAIAKGSSYEQILTRDLAWSYHDIFQAAAEALQINRSSKAEETYSIEQIRQEHARAYQKWDAAQDEQLRQLLRCGKTSTDIALIMQRQPGAIRSRLVKMGLIHL